MGRCGPSMSLPPSLPRPSPPPAPHLPAMGRCGALRLWLLWGALWGAGLGAAFELGEALRGLRGENARLEGTLRNLSRALGQLRARLREPSGASVPPYGALWSLMEPYGPYGALWNPIQPYGPYGALWSPMEPMEPYGAYGALWSPMEPYGTL